MLGIRMPGIAKVWGPTQAPICSERSSTIGKEKVSMRFRHNPECPIGNYPVRGALVCDIRVPIPKMFVLYRSTMGKMLGSRRVVLKNLTEGM